jgi:hypothetical protein
MYIDSCKLNFLLDKSLNLEDISVKSANEFVFNFTSIELCNETTIETINGTDITFCNPIVNYFNDEKKGVDLDNFKIYTVTYKPIVVGLSSLDFILESTGETISFDIVGNILNDYGFFHSVFYKIHFIQ